MNSFENSWKCNRTSVKAFKITTLDLDLTLDFFLKFQSAKLIPEHQERALKFVCFYEVGVF